MGKIPSISGLATNTALMTVEHKIANISCLVKKKKKTKTKKKTTDYNKKITDIEKNLTDHNHDKYIATPELLLFSMQD